MALVTITEAAKLVRRSRQTLYRDIDRGRLSKTITPEGAPVIDTSELLRVYGALHRETDEQGRKQTPDGSPVDDFEELVETWEYPDIPPPKNSSSEAGASADKAQLHILEERIKSLEHVLALESTLRKVKDEVTTELRARLEEKERLIRVLENKVMALDYSEPPNPHFPRKQKSLLSRLFNIR